MAPPELPTDQIDMDLTDVGARAGADSSPAPSPDAVLHLLTLRLLSDAGFASTSRAASLTLSSIAAKYLHTIGAACVQRAELAGRSKAGAGDVLGAMEEMGMGVEELGAWVDEAAVGSLSSGCGVERLGAELQDGLELPQAIAELKLVPSDRVPVDDDDESVSDGEDATMVEDENEDANMQTQQSSLPPQVSFASNNDDSWLPPLPGAPAGRPHLPSISTSQMQPQIRGPPDASASRSNIPAGPSSTATGEKLSLLDKYRTRVPFESSLLASSFTSPPIATTPFPYPPKTSSLDSLVATYAAVQRDPSVSLPQTALRQQAFDLLTHSIAPPDMFDPPATLSPWTPPPRLPTIHASAPSSDTLPPVTLPINNDTRGVLSRLVREIRSPYLPPALRDRLTTIRPPLAQMRDGQPIYYGEPVRGPDAAALNKARGKPAAEAAGEGEGEGQGQGDKEEYYRYTWDVPRGPARFSSARLPSGKGVVKSGVGEDTPRTTPGGPAAQGAVQAQQGEAPVTAGKIRLTRSPSTALRPELGASLGSGAGPAAAETQRRESAIDDEGDTDMSFHQPPPRAARSASTSTSATSSSAQKPTLPQLKIPSDTVPPPPARPVIRLTPSPAQNSSGSGGTSATPASASRPKIRLASRDPAAVESATGSGTGTGTGQGGAGEQGERAAASKSV